MALKIMPHGRLQEWVAEEKGYFRAEGLDYEFRELIRSSDGQHGREGRQRNVTRQGCRDQHEQQQKHRMQHPRYRAAGAGTDIGRGARDGAGDADSAEQG